VSHLPRKIPGEILQNQFEPKKHKSWHFLRLPLKGHSDTNVQDIIQEYQPKQDAVNKELDQVDVYPAS
jgi:hypothetical protein